MEDCQLLNDLLMPVCFISDFTDWMFTKVFILVPGSCSLVAGTRLKLVSRHFYFKILVLLWPWDSWYQHRS